MTNAVILCSRMNSHRFPGKALADLCGKPVIGHVLDACKAIEGIDLVVVAVPDKPENVPLLDLAKEIGCKSFAWDGNEDDVLGRMRAAARKFKADYIVRVTHDCPLLDPVVCSRVLDAAMQPGIDYASNVMPRTFETGLDCEAFTRWALELCASKASTPTDREHVTPWMQRSDVLRRINVESGEPDRAGKNYCVDFPEDLERVKMVLEMREAA